ncbi:MAG: HD domain-containing protein [Longimicrobiales bacterium]
MHSRPVLIRDPLWDTIRLDPIACRIVDSAVFQRLRYIRQLGLAHLVYPGATHTRFDHAIGVYHLAQRTVGALHQRGDLRRVPEAEARLIPLAALLHDIGHYPFSHALEELDEGSIPGHHETLVGHFLADPGVTQALLDVAADAAPRIEQLIRGASDCVLQGLVSGSLDLDKIEYLKRDARFCGVPYGDVDVDRLLHSLLVVEDPHKGKLEVGVHEKGMAALESLLFAKYQMFRNVYWHHAVRAATVMYKRIVLDALEQQLIQSDELIGQTDEGLLHLLAARDHDRSSGRAADKHDERARIRANIGALRARTLPKRAAEVVAADLEAEPASWIAVDSPVKRAVEEQLTRELELPPHSVFLDFPEKSAMFHLHLLVQRRDGEVLRLGPGGQEGLIGLPRIADELYRTARVLRVFTLYQRRRVAPAALVRLAQLSEADVQAELERGTPLLR